MSIINMSVIIAPSGEFEALAAGGMNTFRKATDKYNQISIGDEVRMHYRRTPDCAPVLIETMQIKSFVTAPLPVLVQAHGRNNHAVRSGILTVEGLSSYVLGLYRDQDPASTYIAIYF